MFRVQPLFAELLKKGGYFALSLQDPCFLQCMKLGPHGMNLSLIFPDNFFSQYVNWMCSKWGRNVPQKNKGFRQLQSSPLTVGLKFCPPVWSWPTYSSKSWKSGGRYDLEMSKMKSVETQNTQSVNTGKRSQLTLDFQNRLTLLTLLSLHSCIKLHHHLIHHTKCLWKCMN